MITLNPYVNFGMKAREAMTFYHDILGGELDLQVVGESPARENMPAEYQDKIMHGVLRRDGNILLMGSDMLMAGEIKSGNVIRLNLNFTEETELRAAYDRMSEGGVATTPPRQEFWGGIYSELTDKFGIEWMFNCETPAKHDEA